jgi:hypothetical protein
MIIIVFEKLQLNLAKSKNLDITGVVGFIVCNCPAFKCISNFSERNFVLSIFQSKYEPEAESY